jgi:hypothetical protein
VYGNNQYVLDNLNRQKDRIDEMIRNYQQTQQQPVNNFINTAQTLNKDLIEWRVLNENEEVDNLYVSTKTLFINDNLMVLKDVNGSLEKWEVKKIYPIDKKDEKINALEEKIKELEMKLNEPTKSSISTREFKQPNGSDDVNAEPKSKTNGKSISK